MLMGQVGSAGAEGSTQECHTFLRSTGCQHPGALSTPPLPDILRGPCPLAPTQQLRVCSHERSVWAPRTCKLRSLQGQAGPRPAGDLAKLPSAS